MLKYLVLLLTLVASPALAQQAQFTPHQQQMMELGQQIGLLRAIISDLQIENAALKKQLEELKAKYESKPDPVKK